ncbi:hypothetical protein F183_A47480 [Bryobacterales bacterium F-183]|nr:hypothetical protein F183_A47480 [Bryobacterales bacterium F-183]
MRVRFLRQDERVFATKVFGRTLPLDDVLVTDLLGAGNEPFTAVSAPNDGPFLIPIPKFIYALNMGKDGFENCISPPVRAGFVRELARIRQGPMSVAGTRLCGRKDYELGQPWTAYDSQQKASLVEDWYRGGMRIDDPRMPYIQAHVRRGGRG